MTQPKASAAHGVASRNSKRYGLDYDSCSRKELFSFLRSRSIGYDESAPITRRAIIKLLEHADREATFRFTDLAGELRNRICEELLILDQASKCCFPQILATCTQLHKDATSILYGANDIEVDILGRGIEDWMYSYDLNVTLRCGRIDRALPTKPLSQLPTGPARWPPFLAKFRHVRVSITLYHIDQLHMYIARTSELEALLLSTAAFLQSSKHLKTVTVAGYLERAADFWTHSWTVQLLRPLGRLAPTFECDFEGFDCDPDIPRDLRQSGVGATKVPCARDMVYKFALVAIEVAAAKSFGWKFATCATQSRIHEVGKVIDQLSALEMDQHCEHVLASSVRSAVEVLDDVHQEMVDGAARFAFGICPDFVEAHAKRVESFAD